MFGLGLPEIIVILIVALLVVGPSKLPELARSLGKAFSQFKRMADDVKETIEDEVLKEDLEKEQTKEILKETAEGHIPGEKDIHKEEASLKAANTNDTKER